MEDFQRVTVENSAKLIGGVEAPVGGGTAGSPPCPFRQTHAFNHLPIIF